MRQLHEEQPPNPAQAEGQFIRSSGLSNRKPAVHHLPDCPCELPSILLVNCKGHGCCIAAPVRYLFSLVLEQQGGLAEGPSSSTHMHIFSLVEKHVAIAPHNLWLWLETCLLCTNVHRLPGHCHRHYLRSASLTNPQSL